MHKKGISKIITVVFLILLVFVVILIVFIVVKGIMNSSKEEVEQEITCLTEVDLAILDACYELSDVNSGDEKIKFILVNKNNFNYDTKYFLLNARRIGEDSAFGVPTNMPETLKGLEQRQFEAIVDNPQEIEEIIFIPKIKQEKGYCYGQTIKFKVEGEC